MVPDAQQGQEQGRVAPNVRFFRSQIHGPGPLENLQQLRVPQAKAEHHRADHGGGAVPTADGVEHVERAEIAGGVVHGRTLAGNREKMTARLQSCLAKGLAHQRLVGHGFEGGAAFRHHVHQGFAKIKPA